MGKIKGWKQNRRFKEGHAYSSDKKEILITENQFGAYQTHIFGINPYFHIHRRKFKTFKKAQNFAIRFMRRHPNG